MGDRTLADFVWEAQPGPWRPENRDTYEEDDRAIWLTNDDRDSLIIEADTAALLVNAVLRAALVEAHPYHEACPQCWARFEVMRQRAVKAESMRHVPLGRVTDMALDGGGLTVTVECDDQEGYERLMRTWEQTERAISIALEPDTA